MGMIWRSTMPLLSTLAALVIIVHSAEEEVERGYRRDLRPRPVDAASYEQPWKSIDIEPLVQQPTRAEAWIEPPDEGPPRRRPVRKRKRRPVPYPDTEPQERHQESIQAVYHDADFHDPPHMIEAPKKRRKRPDRPQTGHINHHFSEEPVNTEGRPLRRRGLRKKRPDFDEQLGDAVTPTVYEPEDFNNDRRLQHYNKYNNDQYDDFDHIYIDSETENVRGKPNATAEKINYLPDYKEDVPEQHNKQSIANAESVSLVSSSEENQGITQNTIREVSTEPPEGKNVDNGNKSNAEADIMIMMNEPKVEKMKLGIIINGTEYSYLPLILPQENMLNEFSELVIDITQATSTTDGTNDFTDVDYTAEQSNDYDLLHEDNSSKPADVIKLQHKSMQKVISAYTALSSSTEMPYGTIWPDYEENHFNYIIFPISSNQFIAIYHRMRNQAKTIQKKISESSNDIEQTIILPIPKEETSNNVQEASAKIWKDRLLSDRILKEYVTPKYKTLIDYNIPKQAEKSKELIYSDYAIPKEDDTLKKEPLFDYDIPKEVINPKHELYAGYAILSGDLNKTKEENHIYYETPEDIPLIHKEIHVNEIPKDVIYMQRVPGDFVTTPHQKNIVDDIPNDAVYISKASNKIMHQPNKWINTRKMTNNKWIANVKFLVPMLSPRHDFQFEFIPGSLEKNGAIDPVILKQLLKRSNGSSLSEILQKHNLSLTDLLQGRDEAISAINADASGVPHFYDISQESNSQLKGAESIYPTRRQTSREKHISIETSSNEETKGKNSNVNIENVESVTSKDIPQEHNRETMPRMSTKRRFPTGIRRKLRMRPMLNSTLKAQLSRDLIALSARKYSHNNKNVTKSREWKDIVPIMEDRSKTNEEISNDDVTEIATTTTDVPIETTISNLEISNSSYSNFGGSEAINIKDIDDETSITTTEATTTIIIEVSPAEINTETEKPKVTPIVRPSANNSTLRRQAFNNRLKRKRLKQRTSTTENPTDDLMRNFLGMANLVSASQFIERTQKPYTTLKEETTEFATELEDFMTTQAPTTTDRVVKSKQVTTTRFSTSFTTSSLSHDSSTSTEQSAKFEIEEILNDTMTSERLAKILRERNMTLSELVNHRERGSSHVHLADIFHNASKEPNPPEPFLTKSSIEPISKETYPLRAILEANTHETTTRSQGDQNNYIPVVMDFGNNVNENGESMGIISLFNKLTDNEVAIDKAEIRKDSDGTPYVSSINLNATKTNDTDREARVLSDSEDWNELLSFMKAHNITTFEEDLQTLNKGDPEKEFLEDIGDDALMVLDDMQHIQNFENKVTSGLAANVEMNMYERRENLSDKPGILNKLPNNTKSVAIATASILGLAAILFLLTYIAFRWKQHRNKLRKKESFCDVHIPSPVFENRKGHKNNCSSRSISPMISNTNIYMSTLESNGKESPDYMWNSLRKPFQ